MDVFGGPCWWKVRASVRWRRSLGSHARRAQDAAVFRAAGLPAGAAGKAAQVGAVDRRDQRHSGEWRSRRETMNEAETTVDS